MLNDLLDLPLEHFIDLSLIRLLQDLLNGHVGGDLEHGKVSIPLDHLEAALHLIAPQDPFHQSILGEWLCQDYLGNFLLDAWRHQVHELYDLFLGLRGYPVLVEKAADFALGAKADVDAGHDRICYV